MTRSSGELVNFMEGMEAVSGQWVGVFDCLEWMRRCPDEFFDLVVTSPPYNLNKAYTDYEDSLDWDDYFEWVEEIATEIRRILHPKGSLFLNVGASCVEPWISLDVASRFRKIFSLQNHIVWVKSISIDGDSRGHFKPINSPRFVNRLTEDVWHFTESGRVSIDRLAIGVPYKDKSNIERWEKEDGDVRCAGNAWFIPYETINSREKDRFNHPAPFPVELAERCIKLHGVSDGMRVLDPFMGIGPVLMACAELGIEGYGVDVSEDYFSATRQRLTMGAEGDG